MMTEVEFKKYNNRISQGDIYKNVWCFENISQENNSIKINRVFFPYVIVLTQDCDIQQHQEYVGQKSGQLFSVLVAPLYNAGRFFEGKHLEQLHLKSSNYISNKGTMLKSTNQKINSEGQLIVNNQIARYHYLEFKDAAVPPSIVDFKHYFSLGVDYLKNDKNEDFVLRLKPLYRELLTQRFSNYLSRIGLPNPENTETDNNRSLL